MKSEEDSGWGELQFEVVVERKKKKPRLSVVHSYTRQPAGFLGFDVDFIGKRVAALGGDGRDVVSVGVDEGDDFHGGCEEGLLHGSANLCSFQRFQKGQ